MKDSEIEEYLGLRRELRRSKYILLTGIIFVILSLVLASLSLEKSYEIKEIEEVKNLNKGEFFFLLREESFNGISYVVNGTLYINSSKEVTVWLGTSPQYITKGTLKLSNFSSSIKIEALEDDTHIEFKAQFVLVTQIFIFLSIFSLFILIIGSVFSFVGLYYFLLFRRS